MKKQLLCILACIATAIAVVACIYSTRKAGQPVVIDIAPNGRLSVAGQECRRSELATRMKQLAATQPKVQLRIDAGTPYQHVVAVLDACEAAGVRNVTLANTR